MIIKHTNWCFVKFEMKRGETGLEERRGDTFKS